MAVNTEFIERYQIELQKNPRSKVFAPLAEAYRKMGMIDEALRICQIGTGFNPDFVGGLVAFAKILIEKNNPQKALPLLERSVDLSPDNLLAYSLLGETFLKLRRPKDSLKAFKMVLFLNPVDEKAMSVVNKWEFLTADEYDAELFKMQPTFEGKTHPSVGKKSGLDAELEELLQPSDSEQTRILKGRSLERAISLADAFTVRNDLEAALRVIEGARNTLGSRPELEKRFRLLSQRLASLREEANDDDDLEPDVSPDGRRAFLEKLLRRINERRA